MTLTDEKNPHDSTTFYGWHDYTPNVSSSSDAWASTARGWLWNHSENSIGNYCDYGAGHYRSGHDYCKPGKCDCRQSNPGNIHCIVYHGMDGMQHSRYVETVEQAHEWIEETAGFTSQFKLPLATPPRLGRSKRVKMSGIVRIADCSGLDSNKLGRLILWSNPKAKAIAREYPFVGGRTPQSMKWVAVELTDGTVTTVPKNRIVQEDN